MTISPRRKRAIPYLDDPLHCAHVGRAVGAQGNRTVVVVPAHPHTRVQLVDEVPRVEVERREIPDLGVAFDILGPRVEIDQSIGSADLGHG